MVNAPFTPSGNSVVFTAATSAPTAVQAVSSTLGGNQYRVLNSGAVTVFMGVGTSASDAVNNATVLTTTNLSIPLLAGTDEILTFPPNAYFSGITSTSTAVVYITPGDGA
jgi:hypothetical protein